MNYNELVDLIVKEVYSKLQQPLSTIKSETIDERKTLVVFDEENIEKYNSIVGHSYKIIPYTVDVKDCDVIFLSKLCLKGLANLATLNLDTPEQDFMVRMLMKGKKVYILEDGIQYRRYKNTAPKPLYNKYIEFEKELIKHGMDIIESISSIEDRKSTIEAKEKKVEAVVSTIGNSMVEENSFEIRNKKLISEADLKKPFMNGMKSVVIDKKSIITPLANDFIRLHHLKVKRV